MIRCPLVEATGLKHRLVTYSLIFLGTMLCVLILDRGIESLNTMRIKVNGGSRASVHFCPFSSAWKGQDPVDPSPGDRVLIFGLSLNTVWSGECADNDGPWPVDYGLERRDKGFPVWRALSIIGPGRHDRDRKGGLSFLLTRLENDV
jgi:hypothetical protein